MEEMISRDAALTILNHNWGKPKGYSQSINEISELPPVQPKHGAGGSKTETHIIVQSAASAINGYAITKSGFKSAEYRAAYEDWETSLEEWAEE